MLILPVRSRRSRVFPRAVATLSTSLALIALPGTGMATSVEDFVSGELRARSENPVQAAVGQVVGQICPSGTIITDSDLQDRCNEIAVGAVVEGDDIPGARDALQAMGAEEDAAVASTQVDARSGQMDAIGQRISNVRGGATTGISQLSRGSLNWAGGAAGDTPQSPWGVFVTGTYADADRDTTAREAGFESEDYGVTAGVDYSFDDKVLLGAAFGYRNSDADIDNNGGKLETDSYSFFAYWSLYPNEHLFIDAMAGYTNNDHDQERNIIYNIAALAGGTTTVNNTAVSDTESDEWSISVKAGRNYFVGNWIMAPLVRIEYADVEIDGFTETMAQANAAGSGLALQIDGQDFESLMAAAGGLLTTEWNTGLGTIYPEVSFEYVHEFKNNNQPITGRFVNDSSATTIVLLTDGPDRNFFNIGAGFTAVMSDNASGFFRYQGLIGYEDLDVHAFEVGVRLTF